MLDIEKISDGIECLEECGNTSYEVCNKLAILYTVRDHLEKQKERNVSSQYTMSAPMTKGI